MPKKITSCSDGEVYQSETFSNLIHEELGRPWWIRVKAPVWVLRVVTFFGEYIGRMTGKMNNRMSQMRNNGLN